MDRPPRAPLDVAQRAQSHGATSRTKCLHTPTLRAPWGWGWGQPRAQAWPAASMPERRPGWPQCAARGRVPAQLLRGTATPLGFPSRPLQCLPLLPEPDTAEPALRRLLVRRRAVCALLCAEERRLHSSSFTSGDAARAFQPREEGRTVSPIGEMRNGWSALQWAAPRQGLRPGRSGAHHSSGLHRCMVSSREQVLGAHRVTSGLCSRVSTGAWRPAENRDSKGAPLQLVCAVPQL